MKSRRLMIFSPPLWRLIVPLNAIRRQRRQWGLQNSFGWLACKAPRKFACGFWLCISGLGPSAAYCARQGHVFLRASVARSKKFSRSLAGRLSMYWAMTRSHWPTFEELGGQIS
jgi:hypothetical protein